MGALLREILATQLHVAAGQLILWSAIGLVGGAALGWVAHAAAARLGAWELGWRHVRWLRIAAAAWACMGLALFGMAIGALEGALRGTDVIVRQSQFRHGVLDRAGAYGSLGIAWVDLYLAAHESSEPLSDADRERHWAAFANGESEIDAPAFLARLERSQEALVREAASAARERLRALDGYGGGLVARLVELSLGVLTHRYTRGAAVYLLGTEGAEVSRFFATLPAAAAAHGSSSGLSHRELSAHVVEQALIPNILGPTRLFARANQWGLAAVAPVVPLVPWLVFWVARRVEALSRKATTSAPGPDM